MALISPSLILRPSLVFGNEPSAAEWSEDGVKLSANENPYGPSKLAQEAIRKHIVNGNRYPNELRNQLTEQLAECESLDKSNILLGAGSSDLLQLLACWCVHENKSLHTSKLTFDILPGFVKRFSGHVLEAEQTEDKGFDLVKIEANANENPGLVYLVNPNNPTGSKLNYNELLAFCKRVSRHSFVIVDEAYIEYVDGNESVSHLIRSNDRIIVVRTFSKIHGLAGLRVGYLLGHSEVVQLLKKYQVWSGANLNVLGMAAAQASLTDSEFLNEARKKNEENRSYTHTALKRLGRYCVEPNANFIWFDCGNRDGTQLSHVFAQNNIIVGAGTVDGSTWMRVTIGKEETMQRFIKVAKSIWT